MAWNRCGESWHMPDNTNNITIVIKTFARPQCLGRLLKSIRSYYPAIPILVADDSLRHLSRDTLARFPHLEYIPLKFDVGVSAGRNALLARVKTPYFVLCDDDFVFDEKTRLEAFAKILDETDVELIGGCVMDLSLTGTGQFDRPNVYAGHLILDAERNLRIAAIQPERPFVRCDIVPNWFMAKTEPVRQKTGGWDPLFKTEEHTDFFWRARQAGLRVAFTMDVCVNHAPVMNRWYRLFRRTRRFKYQRILFKKLGLRSFSDKWEVLTAESIQPWFVRLRADPRRFAWGLVQGRKGRRMRIARG